ncbi:unnamed protein product [Pleuronectes platessa]|uniref:Uncharacterized protein n=1 Tax=Pleuronectes platessa TaxID=8262 RepID=A0A9N7U699_PLEPL|nr:unnamed protein product [Pleuronectes platessa]
MPAGRPAFKSKALYAAHFQLLHEKEKRLESVLIRLLRPPLRVQTWVSTVSRRDGRTHRRTGTQGHLRLQRMKSKHGAEAHRPFTTSSPRVWTVFMTGHNVRVCVRRDAVRQPGYCFYCDTLRGWIPLFWLTERLP